jgi:hypothetical protein
MEHVLLMLLKVRRSMIVSSGRSVERGLRGENRAIKRHRHLIRGENSHGNAERWNGLGGAVPDRCDYLAIGRVLEGSVALNGDDVAGLYKRDDLVAVEAVPIVVHSRVADELHLRVEHRCDFLGKVRTASRINAGGIVLGIKALRNW